MDKFCRNVKKCIYVCERELLNRKNGRQGESTIAQLESILLEMEKIMIEIKSKNLPIVSERFVMSFANAFTIWGWNMQHPTKLYRLLRQLNDDYKKL